MIKLHGLPGDEKNFTVRDTSLLQKVRKNVSKYINDDNSINEEAVKRIEAKHNKEIYEHACRYGNLDTIKQLVAKGFDVHQRLSYNNTGLTLAAEYEHMDTVKYLHQQGLSLNARGDGGYDALMFACEQNKYRMVKFLIEMGADKHYKDIDPYATYGTGFTIACTRSNHRIIKLLLDAGVKHTVFNFASVLQHNRRIGVTKLFLDYGYEVNCVIPNYGSPLMAACDGYGQEKVVKYLLKKGANVNYQYINGMTALMTACEHYNEELVKILLNAGANVHLTESAGRTALHLACINTKLDIMKLLVNAGSDVNAVDNRGCTPLDIVESEFVDVQDDCDHCEHELEQRQKARDILAL